MHFVIPVIIVLILFSACEPLAQPIQHTPTFPETISATETQEPTKIPAIPTATEQPIRIWFDPVLPAELLQRDLSDFDAKYGVLQETANMRLTFSPQGWLSQWIFALVAPFATVADSVTSIELLNFWQNGAAFPATELVMDQTALTAFTARYGTPVGKVILKQTDELLSYCKASGAWAVISFGEIEPMWKVIAIDGQSPLHKSFDVQAYPLTAGIALLMGEPALSDPTAFSLIETELQSLLPTSNRDENKLTTVILTGVTALTRATAKEMEIYGILTPAQSIGAVMREADIAHVSNEVPFASDCPEPQWVQDVDLVFCSDDRYIDLLKEIGTDVVELTGDHFRDWGPEAMLHTLGMYDAEGWSYYGGGKDIGQAKAPLKLENNGNKIAFIGCNAKAPGYATASETNPGAYHCDMDYMVSAIQQLRSEGYLVIATFQHDEIYLWQPEPNMVADFRLLAEAGATIVSGSQAHQPHIYEFWEDTFIHYGLGNLFFDQLGWYDDSDKAFIDRHVFYNDKYLGVELLTTQFFNWSTPTWMTPDARAELLTRLFEYSQEE
jgi:poly-gamma-glutamate synthesis protein (capsule biosynthesis protein)